jgi:hypothetical protein
MNITFGNRVEALLLGVIGSAIIGIASSAAEKDAFPVNASNPALMITPIIEFNRIIPSLAGSRTKPLLRVYADGTVLVHFPVYMKRSGDYSMQLSPKELERLLSRLRKLGVFDINSGALKLQKEQNLKLKRKLASSKHSGQRVREILDADITEIYVQLNGDTSATPDPSAFGNIRKHIKWYGLRWDAEDFPEMPQLKQLLEAENILEHLTRDPALKRNSQ